MWVGCKNRFYSGRVQLHASSSEPESKRLRASSPSLPLDADMVSSLPALPELVWNASIFPQQLVLPWSQLSLCELRRVQISDVHWILSFLPPTSRVTAIGIVGSGFHPAKESQIRSLKLEHSSLVLVALIAPILRKLDMNERLVDQDAHFIRSFMNSPRSACHLEHLRIRPGINLWFWFKMLESPYARDISRLDISCRDPEELLAALAKGNLVPSLRTLAIRGTGTGNANIPMPRTFLAARNPTVRIESFKRWEWDFPQRDDPQDGLDVVFLE
ncbi:hypothetical protein FB45DRAFT_874173 [Roridomyces roridus]|uniref:Uncharacterized protein n=1 Tax=Roridomyces roridus TaxID=1738132 RepID=A0AAD7B8R2_9AGAR|nr:hypothetical protein FB45DRAFT_874173 [Roridomyces roridus]